MNRLKSICMAVFCLLAKEWLWQATSPMTNPEGSHPLLSNEKDTSYWCLFAEREGFEPPVPLGTVVFKTTVIDHSTISPVLYLS